MKDADIHTGHTYAGRGGATRTVLSIEPASTMHRANFKGVNGRRRVTFSAMDGAVQKTVTLHGFAVWARCDVTDKQETP